MDQGPQVRIRLRANVPITSNCGLRSVRRSFIDFAGSGWEIGLRPLTQLWPYVVEIGVVPSVGFRLHCPGLRPCEETGIRGTGRKHKDSARIGCLTG